jgi:bile acid:Na+ symporter, BASS family
MDLAKVMQLVLGVSVMVVVFCLGLEATPQDLTYLFRHPKRLVRSMLAMLIIMPVFAGFIVHAFDLPPTVAITVIVLSVSPVPPLLPRRQIAAGGTRLHALGTLVAAAVISIVFVPAAVHLFGKFFDRPAGISSATIARIVTISVIGPLAVGMMVRRFWAGFARRAATPLSQLAMLLLVAGTLPVVFTQISAVKLLIGHGTLLTLIVFVLVGLVSGALLGGPELSHRIDLALATASRHPGVAMAIASANFPNPRFVIPAILLYLVVCVIVSGIFLAWLRRRERAMTRDSGRSAA